MTQAVQIRKEWMPTPLAEFQAIVKPREYTDLLTCQSPKFLPFINRYGRPALEEIFGRVILDLSEGLGISISGTMASDAVELIIDDFPDTKLSDLLMFKRDVLGGKVGGQVDDKLWKWNTRAIIQAWSEYYARREDVFCEAREQRYNEEKRAYADGFAKSFANATPEQQQKHRDWVAKMEAVTNAKRVKEEEAKAVIPQKLSLEQIADTEGIDMERLAAAIRSRAEQRQKDENLTIPMMIILQGEMAKVLFAARQNPKYLHELVKPIHD
jgi:hypothetical protein